MTVRFLSILLGTLLLAIVAVVLSRPAGPIFGPSGTLTIVVYTVPASAEESLRMFGLGIGDIHMTAVDGDEDRLGGSRAHRVLLGGDSEKTVVSSHAVRTGEYSRLAFTLKNPELRMAEDANRIRRLSLWRENISLPLQFTVTQGESTVILIGFEVARALRENGDELVYVPTLQVESRHGVQVAERDGTVEIEGGVIRASALFGMNEQGTMQMNYRMPIHTPQEEQVPIAPDEETEDGIMPGVNPEDGEGVAEISIEDENDAPLTQ
jgi:hypothetical protein